MKKTISLILCMALVMALAAAAFAFGPIGGGGISLSNKYVDAFCKLVDAIGDPVTLEDEEAIEAAYDYAWSPYVDTTTTLFYNAYIGEGPKQNAKAVEAYAKLEAAMEALEALKEGGATEQPTTPPTQEPTQAPTQAPTKPSTPAEPVDPAGDNTFVVMAMVVLSMTAVVVLVSKKRAF